MGWVDQDGTGWGRTRKDFIRDRNQEILLCVPVFLSGGKDPVLFI